MARLLLALHQQESLAIYTDGFRAYDPFEEEDAFKLESVIHGDSKYVDREVYVNTCEGTVAAAPVTLAPLRN